MSVQKMLLWLVQYPKSQEADLLIRGFTKGLYIPLVNSSVSVFKGNLHSIEDNPDVAQEKLDKEVEFGRMAGPFSEPPLPNLRISPLDSQKGSGQIPVNTTHVFSHRQFCQ